MSTDYGLYCLDCRDHIIFDDCRSPEACKALIDEAGKLAELSTVALQSIDIHVTFYHGCALDISWFFLHKGHRQTVVDEYGWEWPRCHKEYLKGSYCVLKAGHDTRCSNRGDLQWY